MILDNVSNFKKDYKIINNSILIVQTRCWVEYMTIKYKCFIYQFINALID